MIINLNKNNKAWTSRVKYIKFRYSINKFYNYFLFAIYLNKWIKMNTSYFIKFILNFHLLLLD